MDGNLILLENLPSKRVARGENVSAYRIDVKINNSNIIRWEVSATPIYDNEGNFIVGVIVGRDIGDRLKNEENSLLKSQYDLLNRTIENLDLGYNIISYPDFKITYMNNKGYDDLKKYNQNSTSLFSTIEKNFFEVFKYNIDEKVEVINNIKDLIEDNKEKISKSINITKQNCYRFTKLINNIVDISKLDSGFFKLNLSNENIVEIIEDIVQSVSEYI